MPETEKARAKRLLDNFKLTIEEWERLNAHQGGRCWICKKPQKSGKRLAVDHCHKSGEIRSLLCSQCNRLLGKIERLWSLDDLTRVVPYLISPPARDALGRIHIGYSRSVTTKKHRRLLKREAKNALPKVQKKLSKKRI